MQNLNKSKINSTLSKLKQDKQSVSQKYDKYCRGVDLLFLMDCTGSMSSWINVTVEKILLIAEQAKESYNGILLRIGFIGYRDHNDGDRRLQFIDFTEDHEQVKTFVSSMKAGGGDDAPEDIAGALDKAKQLGWISSTRLIIHFGDAPCHGTKYHNLDDSYPGGDPNGLDIEDIVRELGSTQRVDYYFGKINSTTDQMTNIFKDIYSNTKRSFVVIDLGNSVENFLPTVLRSISMSMKSSIARGEMPKEGLSKLY